MVHGDERPIDVTLPDIDGVTRFISLWSSADESPSDHHSVYAPGEIVSLVGTSMQLFRAE
jgi:glycogen operon protein